MTRWKLTLSYDGTHFHGWQVQPSQPTVQGTLAKAIQSISGEHILPQGSGRTDSGVHALGQVASFSMYAPLPRENLLQALNRALPPSIRVLSAEIVPSGFHARHDATRKAYEYRIFQPGPATICPPFLAPYVWDCRWQLDPARMQDAAVRLLGVHDFTSFAAADADLATRTGTASGPNPKKTLFTSEIVQQNGMLFYRVTGSGFLHHMVRNIVGTLAEIGRGALVPSSIEKILAAKDRSAAGPTAPPQGLFLVSVEYAGPQPTEVQAQP